MKKEIKTWAIPFIATAVFVGCSKDDNNSEVNNPVKVVSEVPFNVGYAVGLTGSAEGYIQALTHAQITDPNYTITWQGKGYTMGKARGHHTQITEDGKKVYFLNYLTNNLEKITPKSDGGYDKLGEVSLQGAVQGQGRWRTVNEKEAVLVSVSAKHSLRQGVYKANPAGASTAEFVIIDLDEFVIKQAVKKVTLPNLSDIEGMPERHIWRLDNPLVMNGKIYIGTAQQGYDKANNKMINNDKLYPATTLVLDYPSFENPKIISSGIKTAVGESYGYRTKSYFEYNGNIYHTTMDNTHIVRIKADGSYDDTYHIDLQKALGLSQEVGGTGIFYVANGIAYVPYFEGANGASTENKTWSIARVDLNNKTAIKMNVPADMYMWYYQGAKVVDGELYLALNSLERDGNIYIFNHKEAHANGFKKGAIIKGAGDSYYLGVF